MQSLKGRYAHPNGGSKVTTRYELPVLIRVDDCPMLLTKEAADTLVKLQTQAIADWVDNEIVCDYLGVPK